MFQRFNQKKMRVDCYQNVHSAVAHANTTGEELQAGKRIVLMSSFTGGPRDQNQRFQDAIAVVRKTRAPSLFITKTCNPKVHRRRRKLLRGTRFRPPRQSCLVSLAVYVSMATRRSGWGVDCWRRSRIRSPRFVSRAGRKFPKRAAAGQPSGAGLRLVFATRGPGYATRCYADTRFEPSHHP